MTKVYVIFNDGIVQSIWFNREDAERDLKDRGLSDDEIEEWEVW